MINYIRIHSFRRNALLMLFFAKEKRKFHGNLITALLLGLLVSFHANAQKKRLSCVGNSITAGYGLSNPSKDSYPSQLLGLLGSENWVVGNFGASGRTMLKGGGYSYWDDAQYTNALKSTPDYVVIGLGTNDSKNWLWNWLGSDFKKDYKLMVQSFLDLSTKPEIWIFLLVPGEKADWGIYNSYIDKANVKIKEVALEMGLGLIDLHSAFEGHWPGWFQTDSVHPTVEGAADIALNVKEMLLIPKPEINYANGNVAAPDATDYQWYINGVPVTSENGGKQKQIAVTKKGTYKVSLKLNPNSETRILSKELQVDVPDGVSSATTQEVKIFPNPAFDKVFIKSDCLPLKMTYSIIDLTGKEALRGKIENGDEAISIDKLPSGTYFLSFANGCVKFIKKK